ncbi:unnamed protein product [Notodromas monacha]|uniref:PAS domain-containing protein n=1 Tax=Notodromas monacha TaxID=399045 RepID=A0A7R9GE57_9CRUS|nr:unnamed protein product [Notodromas monacha]CAG0917689.1 unnamed protein product [Notodromas monacha]
MFGSCLFDYLHPEDVEKVREQLSTQESATPGRVLDLKTGTVKKEGQQSSMRLCMGPRRSFICRMRLGNAQPEALGSSTHLHRIRQRNALGPSMDGNSYAVVHSTGYVKNWPPTSDRGSGEEDPSNSHCCLVAIGRLQVTSTPNTNDLVGSAAANEFISRHGVEGKFSFADQRVVGLLGYSPPELLGESLFELVHPEEQSHIKDSFEQVVKLKGQVMSLMYRFRAKNHDWVWLRTSAFAFLNPYTDDTEYVVCTNSTAKSLHPGGDGTGVDQGPQTDMSASQYGQPGLDYSLHRTTQAQYLLGGHGHGQARPPSAAQQPSYGGYDSAAVAVAAAAAAAAATTSSQSPLGFSSPSGGPSRLTKSATPPTPTQPQASWSQVHMRPNGGGSGYAGYSGISPSRSPSAAAAAAVAAATAPGPTYTQLSNPASAVGSPSVGSSRGSYLASSSASSGMWSWQGGATQAEGSPAGGASAVSNGRGGGNAGSGGAASSGAMTGPQPPHAHAGHSHPPSSNHELSDMMQLLDHSGATPFEELNMFNTNFE